MERLTKRIDGEAVHFDCHGTCGTCDGCTCFEIGGMVDRLAAYEDTGLSPADIADIRNELCLKCGRYKTAHEGSCDGCRWKKGDKNKCCK